MQRVTLTITILSLLVMAQYRDADARQGIRPPAPPSHAVVSADRAEGPATFVTHNRAMLSWEPVDDPRVVGYEVWKGKTPNDLGAKKVGNVTSYTFEDLAQGYIWYFAVSSYDIKGNRSALSNMVMKIIGKVKGTTKVCAANLNVWAGLSPDPLSG